MLNILESINKSLHDTVKDFLVDGYWVIPSFIESRFPLIASEIRQQLVYPFHTTDSLIWSGTDDGLLTFKQAYQHLNPPRTGVAWGSLIWNHVISPSRSFLLWWCCRWLS